MRAGLARLMFSTLASACDHCPHYPVSNVIIKGCFSLFIMVMLLMPLSSQFADHHVCYVLSARTRRV